MVLFSFSIASMIDKIKEGSKRQTTRIPRKARSNGKLAYAVGDKAQLYYRSRMARTCDNCIVTPQPNPCNHFHSEMIDCPYHNNFFGESEIIEIRHYNGNHNYAENGDEIWVDIYLADEPMSDKDSWAKADGFESWKDALQWFGQTNPIWAIMPLDVITWDAEPIIKRWQQK